MQIGEILETDFLIPIVQDTGKDITVAMLLTWIVVYSYDESRK